MGKTQPADVGLNRVIKCRLKQSQLQYLINVHQAQIASGLTPKQVEISTSLPVLRDATVAGLVEVYDFMTSFAGRQLVKKVCTDVFCDLILNVDNVPRPGSDAQQRNGTSRVNASQARRREWLSMIIFTHTSKAPR